MSPAPDDQLPRGLPGPLPEGESILWQGAPQARALARRALHERLVLLYFLGAACFVAGISWSRGRSVTEVAVALGLTALACLAVVAIIRIYAALVARTTVYTLTTRRIVMRIGVAWPITVNLPHAEIAGAAFRADPDGTGDIPVALGGEGRLAYFHLWPHARPWRVGRPEPMLRALPEVGQVAALLARSLGSGPLGRAAAARADSASAPDLARHPAAAA
ncbi:photosynthetic complex putative assembly protein PuhB [uncultured Enterovirga sp.]|uniref:photosynthetic complex putative assembly protein PuhB n=1 Tax=uncultured Enterovirga sp. TaxID=2026352 RepID=UPI0035CA2EFA